jgi:hypothetical protein
VLAQQLIQPDARSAGLSRALVASNAAVLSEVVVRAVGRYRRLWTPTPMPHA